ncbi:uncharacterized protein PAC_06184 [Phialocephala subalpina]|uniref:Heterokaryon incompatibility domain-containing protein n=1 Tax=Phialocephala subalpina TaxID=576137 RepID=A0A1L7WU40_9HELO|nr:uncharacterized protein PAC_06184 [Phialocephala subalpina]
MSSTVVNDSSPADDSGIYKALDASKREIRILQILPSEQDDATVQCVLHTVSLDDNPDYLTLSYVWGNGNIPKEEVIVNGAILPIMPNLVSALRHLRRGQFYLRGYGSADTPFFAIQSLSHSLRLWADAICINQNDEQERTSQVQLMGPIYSQTSLAISWLGADAADELQDGIRLMMLIRNELECDMSRAVKWLDKYPLLFQCDKDSAHLDRVWSSLRAFLNLEYWKRKWIIQEIALPNGLVFMAGSSMIPYDVVYFSQAFLRGVQNGRVSRPKCATIYTWAFIKNKIWEPELAQLSVCLAFRQDNRQKTLLDSSSSYSMATRSVFFACSNPQDHIFALQGLLKNHQLPSYNKSTRQVYCEFAGAWVEETNRLDLLRFTGMFHGGSNTFSLPSWVPDWHFLSKNGRAYSGIRAGSADKGLGDFSSYTPLVTTDFILKCTGILIDKIDTVTEPRVMGNNLLQLCFQLGKRRTIREILELIVRIGPYYEMKDLLDSKEASVNLFASFLQLLTWDGSSKNSDVMIPALEKLGLLKDGVYTLLFYQTFPGFEKGKYWVGDESWRPFCLDHIRAAEDLARTLFNYISIIETSGTFFGYTYSSGVQKGDIVCVFNGCDTPVILRQQESSYSFVGLCFVQGLLDGEAAEMVCKGERVIEQLMIS